MDKNYFGTLLKTDLFEIVQTGQDVLESEKLSISEYGIEHELYIEKAGLKIADFLIAFTKANNFSKPYFVFFVGKGNNGADTLSAARNLLSKLDVDMEIILATDKNDINDYCKKNLDLLETISKKSQKIIPVQIPKSSVCQTDWNKYSDFIFIDGLLGSGLRKSPSENFSKLINFINQFSEKNKNCTVISVDVPSGLSLEAEFYSHNNIKAYYTITFDYLKRVHVSEPTKIHCGISSAFNIGLFSTKQEKNYIVNTKKALLEFKPPIKPSSFKNVFGHIMVLKGHEDTEGASILSALSALRSGAGLVTLLSTKNDTEHGILTPPELMHKKYNKDQHDFFDKIDGLVIGPGLSKDKAIQNTAVKIVNQAAKRCKYIVLDADGLDLVKTNSLDLSNCSVILTPHPKEAAGILNIETSEVVKNRFSAAHALLQIKILNAKEIIWVLKGADTLVFSKDSGYFIFSEDLPILATAGSGDILSGSICSLAIRCESALKGALLAVSLQKEAAKEVSKTISRGMLASELTALFPKLLK